MIDSDKRKAIYLLHEGGMGIREICRRLKTSRNTVRGIIKDQGAMPSVTREDKIEIDSRLLHRLYKECNGWRERIYEKLVEEEGIKIGYSTLTRLLRELDIEGKGQERSHRVPDEPGVEMQHDTSPFKIKVGGQITPLIASVLYFRYSKMRYLKFYRRFNRFKMKCFLHEALQYFGYSARICIIDNTNLARLRGSGPDAVIVPEMEQFSRQYGFEFICHHIGHANRKAGNERSFYTVESNFFPGREFADLADLNRQAMEWATVRMPRRPLSSSRLIPAHLFEFEQAYLIKPPVRIHPPYEVCCRTIDQYGYVSFGANFYWVPEYSKLKIKDKVKLLEYSDCLKIFHKRELLVQYPLPEEGVRNQRFMPPGQSAKYQPKNRKKPTAPEEKKLRSVSPDVGAFLDFAFKHGAVRQKHRYIRQLYRLFQKLAPSLFQETIKRALKYRVTDMEILERIALMKIAQGNFAPASPAQVSIDKNLKNRKSYMEGYSSDEVDLSRYDRLLDEEDES